MCVFHQCSNLMRHDMFRWDGPTPARTAPVGWAPPPPASLRPGPSVGRAGPRPWAGGRGPGQQHPGTRRLTSTHCPPDMVSTARAGARSMRFTPCPTPCFIANTPALTRISTTTKHSSNDKRRNPVVMNSARRSTDYISSELIVI